MDGDHKAGSPVSQDIWFLELEGHMKGPYKAYEIERLVHLGDLDLETSGSTRIFNPRSQAWSTLAETFKHPSTSFSAQHFWQPPPRPQDLRNVQVTPRYDTDGENIDYFSLIKEHRKKAAITVPAPERTPSTNEENLKHIEQIRQGNAQNLGHEETTSVPQSSPVWKVAKKYVLVAAVLSAVFVGGYLFLMFWSNEKRQPASSAAKTQSPNTATAKDSKADPASDLLGQGLHKVKRRGNLNVETHKGAGKNPHEQVEGHNSVQQAEATPPPSTETVVPPPNNSDNTSEAASVSREAPVFFSTSQEDSESERALSSPNPPEYADPNSDPNAGIVQPPENAENPGNTTAIAPY